MVITVRSHRNPPLSVSLSSLWSSLVLWPPSPVRYFLVWGSLHYGPLHPTRGNIIFPLPFLLPLLRTIALFVSSIIVLFDLPSVSHPQSQGYGGDDCDSAPPLTPLSRSGRYSPRQTGKLRRRGYSVTYSEDRSIRNTPIEVWARSMQRACTSHTPIRSSGWWRNC